MSIESLNLNPEYQSNSQKKDIKIKPQLLSGIRDLITTFTSVAAGGSAIALFGRLDSVKRIEELSDLEIGALATLTSSATVLTFKMCCRRRINR